MQVSATLIAAQQAAREARARMSGQLQVPTAPAQTQGSSFAGALEKASDVKGGFSALPLKQTAAAVPTAQPQAPAASGRMGQFVNIVI